MLDESETPLLIVIANWRAGSVSRTLCNCTILMDDVHLSTARHFRYWLRRKIFSCNLERGRCAAHHKSESGTSNGWASFFSKFITLCLAWYWFSRPGFTTSVYHEARGYVKATLQQNLLCSLLSSGKGRKIIININNTCTPSGRQNTKQFESTSL